jgi:hypothetical protein
MVKGCEGVVKGSKARKPNKDGPCEGVKVFFEN